MGFIADEVLALDDRPHDLDRRFGRFSLSMHGFPDRLPDLIAALDGCVVVRAEHMFATNVTDYVALHLDFEPISVGMEIPVYLVSLTRHEGGSTTRTFQKVEQPPPPVLRI